ncbi:hypothetical protein [Piscibacillus salipiscarius]|uniref:Uncharacterized protein n=1 Tax=Piscibacillus salipiscarius TaxID=299480 RepID=A0ABW5QAT1_9BACI
MVIVIYVLISLYAILTGMAGIIQLKENEVQFRSVFFVVVSISMLINLFTPNKNSMIIMLIVLFIIMHILSITEGILTKRKLTYSHHIIRFIFHVILVLLVYNYIV